MAIEIGAVVEGEVTGITNFGAFLQLPGGKVGLIHISEVSNVYVKDIHDFLKEHQKVRAKVEEKPETPARPARPKETPVVEKRSPRQVGPLSFEDKLSKFLKDSDDRLLDLRRNTESKRGGRGASRDR